MSVRTVPRFALAGWLAAALAAQAGAQTPVAPMPRPAGGVENEFGIEVNGVIQLVRSTPPPNCAFDFLGRGVVQAAPAPQQAECRSAMHGSVLSAGENWRLADFHARPAPQARFASATPQNFLVRVNETGTGQFMLGGSFNTDGVCGHGGCNRVVLPPSPAIERCEGVVLWTPSAGSARVASASQPTDMRRVYPLVGVTAITCDEKGTWWVEVQGIPQPRREPQPLVVWAQGDWGCVAEPCQSRPATSPVPPPARGAAIGAATGALIGGAIGQPAAMPNRAGKLAGTWARDLDGIVIAATFTGDEMKLCLTQKAELGDGESVTITFTMTADYAVTNEGLVHGVVTGFDVGTKSSSKAGNAAATLGLELADASTMFQQVVDSPFAFRVKHTSAGVMVSNIKAAGFAGVGVPELALFGGLYKHCKDGEVPSPKAMQPQTYMGGLTLPSPRYNEQSPQYIAPVVELPPGATASPPLAAPLASPPAVLPLPGCGTQAPRLGPPISSGPASSGNPYGPPISSGPSLLPVPLGCPGPVLTPGTGCIVPTPTVAGPLPQGGWCPAPPPGVPAGDFGMMAEVFGQMLNMGRPQMLPPPTPYPQATMPAPVQPTVAVVPSGPPAPVTFQAVKPSPAVVGTWVREVGPVVYVVKIEPDHLTVTATAATEVEDGKVMTQGMVFTADYHLTRDGTTLVGLITSVDATLDGDISEEADAAQLGEELSRIQKLLTDKPFALSVRAYGDVLAIGNVRLPADGDHGALEPLSLIGGRYTAAGNKPLPKPKVMKPNGSRSSLPPASPPLAEITPPTGYVPAPLSSPSAATLPPLSVSEDRIPPARVSETPAPAPTMTPPAPPAPVEEPKPGKKVKKQKPLDGFLLNVYSSDPNERMQQLLYQSEDLRQIQNEWRRFWFNDQPSHLTPEYIHGGIR